MINLADRHQLGKEGEKLAEKFLRKNGHRLRARSYSTRWGEIDLITQHKNVIVFVEVRTQSTDRYGTSYEALRSCKKQRIKKAAKDYLYKYRLMERPYRFDFIQIVLNDTDPPRLEHIEDAF